MASDGDDTKIGTCRWCGDAKVQIYKDNRYCEECDNDIFRCSICKEDQHVHDLCRHVFQNDSLEWRGSGAYIDDDLKEPLFRLFDLMPPTFAADLKAAIRSKRFHTWLVAPMVGWGGTLELKGFSDLGAAYSYGDQILEIGQRDDAEETAEAYHWLASLFDDKTLKANRATIRWIDEYLLRARPLQSANAAPSEPRGGTLDAAQTPDN